MRQRLTPRRAKTQRVGAWLILVALAGSAGLASCGDGGPAEPDVQQPERTAPPSGLVVSDVVYISASPGTFPLGVLATVTNLTTGGSVTAQILDGGFDPVKIPGSPGDELEIAVRNRDGSTTVFRTSVPTRKRPRVVRTQPPKDATEVVLRSSAVVVFSEPIDEKTVTLETIKLLLDGRPVDGTLTLSADGLRAEFTPAEDLAPQTTYTLVITTGVLDLSGDPLEEEVQVSFTTETPPPPPEGVIAFRRNVLNAAQDEVVRIEIYAINADGSSEQLLVPAHATEPAWSPDGQRIAFRRGGALWVMNADGSGLFQLTDVGGGSPSWSPDGSKIVFAGSDSGKGAIFVINVDFEGSGLQKIAELPGQGTAWSPDGSKIAFAKIVPGECCPVPFDIFVMNPDGSGIVNLTQDPTTIDFSPAWSPDGSTILFHRATDAVGQGRGQYGEGDIYIMNANGTALRPIIDSPGVFESEPSWSPDGNWIAFLSDRVGSNDVWIQTPDGRGLTKLTATVDDEFDPPSWKR